MKVTELREMNQLELNTKLIENRQYFLRISL